MTQPIEPVAKPFGWFFETDSGLNPKAGPVYLGCTDQKVAQKVADDEGQTAFDLYPASALEAAKQEGRREGLVEAARVCESISDDYQQRESLKYAELKTDAQTGASECEHAIRALIEGKP